MTKSLRVGLLVVLAVGLAACATTRSNITRDTGPQTTPTAELTGSDNGSEVHTAIGHLLHVNLAGQGWSFTAQPASMVSVITPSTTSVPSDCSGALQTSTCGATAITYLAKQAGTVTLRATRSMCGEARRCTGSEGDFSITVVVGRGVTGG